MFVFQHHSRSRCVFLFRQGGLAISCYTVIWPAESRSTVWHPTCRLYAVGCSTATQPHTLIQLSFIGSDVITSYSPGNKLAWRAPFRFPP